MPMEYLVEKGSSEKPDYSLIKGQYLVTTAYFLTAKKRTFMFSSVFDRNMLLQGYGLSVDSSRIRPWIRICHSFGRWSQETLVKEWGDWSHPIKGFVLSKITLCNWILSPWVRARGLKYLYTDSHQLLAKGGSQEVCSFLFFERAMRRRTGMALLAGRP